MNILNRKARDYDSNIRGVLSNTKNGSPSSSASDTYK